MDQLTYASLSHTHYCYEVGMLKVPAIIINLFRLANAQTIKRKTLTNFVYYVNGKMRVSIITVLWPDKLQPVIYTSIRPNPPTAGSRTMMNRLSLAI